MNDLELDLMVRVGRLEAEALLQRQHIEELRTWCAQLRQQVEEMAADMSVETALPAAQPFPAHPPRTAIPLGWRSVGTHFMTDGPYEVLTRHARTSPLVQQTGPLTYQVQDDFFQNTLWPEMQEAARADKLAGAKERLRTE